MGRTSQSRLDLVKHLSDQISFIRMSSYSYDQGFEGEAKRLAVSIRILVHDTRRSYSLLSTLGIKSVMKFSAVVAPPSSDTILQFGLTIVSAGTQSTFKPILDDPSYKLNFDDWWNASIILSKLQNINLTRRSAILNLSNTDGGAHVDPDLDDDYMALSRQNKFGWMIDTGDSSEPLMENPVNPCTRQIAHELLHTLDSSSEVQKLLASL